MSNWPKTREADLEGIDLADTYELNLTPGKYDFTLTPSEGGKVHLRIRYFDGGDVPFVIRELDAETGQRVAGTFEVPTVALTSTIDGEVTKIDLRFSRALLSHKVHYKFVFQPR